MKKYDEELQPQRNSAVFPAIANFVLLLVTAGLLWAAFSYYQNRIGGVALEENRFITTEWHVLQEYKAQTDRQLKEKEQQITKLRRRYLELKRQNAEPLQLQEVQDQLEQAKQEREELISQKIETPAVPAEQRGSQSAGQSDDGGEGGGETKVEGMGDMSEESREFSSLQTGTALTELLRQRVKSLRTQLEERSFRIQVLEEELSSLRSEKRRIEREYKRTAETQRRRIEELSKEVTELRKSADGVLSELQRLREGENGDALPRVEALKTRALLQALVSSPQIRSAYPQLPESLEHYFQSYGRRKRLEGRREAYSEALEAAEELQQSLGER